MVQRLMERVDVAIIGGGPAGASAALCLARAGLQPLIVERQAERHARVGESLAPSATPLLQRLGLLPAFLATEPLPCYANRSSWGGDGSLTDFDFIRDPHGNGWHIDRRRFEQMLLDAALTAGACLMGDANLAAVERTEGGEWHLGLHRHGGALSMQANFVIDASGRAAAFARRVGVRRTHLDRLVAVTARLQPSSLPAEDSTTMVEAVPAGWWYSAFLPDGSMAAAFMTDPDLLSNLSGVGEAGWLAMLAPAAQTRERIRANGYVLACPSRVEAAGTSHLARFAGAGWLASGDAAISYDPLSSHGIGTAIATGAQAARAAAAYLAGDIGATTQYAHWMAGGLERYLPLWRAYYRQETRWPEAPFWSRRGSQPNVAAKLVPV